MASEPKKMTVVIPTLGRALLIRTLESLIASKGFDDLDIIVAGRIADGPIQLALEALQTRFPAIRHLSVSYEKGDSSEKKNAGWRAATSDIVAFLDDDVVVAPDWPIKMLKAFEDEETALVSGPGLVPSDVPLASRLAGQALASPAAGYVAWRYRHGMQPLLPIAWSNIIGCNMAYRRPVLEEIGGFNPAFWPGEEMIAAYQTEQLGYRLMFCSPAYVYHYPRQNLRRFMKQIYGYGATRIRLIRGGVEMEPTTLVPAVWVAALILTGLGSLVSLWSLGLFAAAFLAHVLFTLVITARMVRESGDWRDTGLMLMIPLMHLSYGWACWVEFFRPNRDLSLPKINP